MPINIEDLTIGEARQIAALFRAQKSQQEAQTNSNSSHPFQIGKNYFIRTVTHHLTGKLVKVTQQELVLEGAAWIADDGRLSDALKNETFNEVEMFPDSQLIVGRASLIDAVTIKKIPTSTK